MIPEYMDDKLSDLTPIGVSFHISKTYFKKQRFLFRNNMMSKYNKL
jgi:hypothetical protein